MFFSAGSTVEVAIHRAASAQHDAPGQCRNISRVRAVNRSSTARPRHSSSSRANSCPIAIGPFARHGLQRGAPCDGQRTAPGPAGRTAAKKSRSTRHRRRTGPRRPNRSTPPGRRPFERPAPPVTGGGAGAVEARTGPGQRRFSTVPAPTHRLGPPAPTTGTRTTHTAPSSAVQVGVGEWSRGRHASGPTTKCAVVPVGSTCTPTTATGGRNRTARPTPSLRVGR